MYLVVIFVVVITIFFVAVAEDTWVSETVVVPNLSH